LTAAALPSPTLLALRESTRALHAGLEARLRLATPLAGRAQYADHVAAMWGWMQPIEQRLWNDGSWPSAVEPAARDGKCAWLQEDMRAAAADGFLPHATAPQCMHHEADLASPAARFGWAYVIEGSMLGGAVLHRRLAARLAPWPMRYLKGYGSDAGRRWRAFLDALEREIDTPARRMAAAMAAAAAFASIDAWFTERGAA
jgi:heme oxygenase